MASLEYVAIPSTATRLDRISDIRPAKRILTSLPTAAGNGSYSANLASPTSNTFSILPQLFLSGALPPNSTSQDTDNDGSEINLLTTRDALSIPTTSTNFKRFVARARPIFWFQDRVEEIVMWRRGWRVTAVWMAAYAFLCYFPRLIFLLPHVALIGIMLSSYPYPSDSTPATPPADSNVNWQANLQAIQNLMGLISDTYDFFYPYTRHLLLLPSHFPFNPLSSRVRPSLPSPQSHPPSPYPPYILSLLILTFPPLLFVLSSAFFPLRAACLVFGLCPLAFTHPRIRPFHPYIGPVLERAAERTFKSLFRLEKRVKTLKNTWWPTQTGTDDKDEDELLAMPLCTILERILDDDRLSDRCWRAEMRQVELWENERFQGIGSSTSTEDAHILSTSGSSCGIQTRTRADSSTSVDSPTTSLTCARPASINVMIGTTNLPAPQLQSHGGWSKSNLRIGERGPWTRRRDGWGGVGAEVSSNLTFSLAPGWTFVPTEGWRKDRVARWALDSDSESRLCSDGWVYTNDTWNDASPLPYQSDGGGGCLTRRRRWVRRVWFDGSAEGGRIVW